MVDLGSTILCCTPSYAAYLAESIHERGLRDQIKLKAGIFGAEAWSEEMRGKTLTPLTISMSSLRPMGLHIFTWVRPQGHFSRVSTQMSLVR